MRRSILLAAALLPLIPLPAAAQVDARSAIIAAGRAGGCAITEAQADTIFPALGLSQDAVREAAQAMIAAGEATGEGDTLRLSPAVCGAAGGPAAPVPAVSDVVDTVMQVFRENGCLLTEAAAMPLFAARGITPEAIDAVGSEFEALEEAGVFVEQDDGSMRLIDPACPNGGRSPMVATVLQVFRENGCVLTEDQAMPLLEARGITEADMEAAEREFEALMAAGTLIEVGDETYRLVDDGCPVPSIAAAVGTPRDRLVRLLAENGCAVDYADAVPLLPAYGLTEDDAERESQALMEAGEATLSGDVLTLAPALCSP